MRFLQFSTDEFDSEHGEEQASTDCGEDTLRALLAAFEEAGHEAGDVWPEDYGWVGTVMAEGVPFEIHVSLIAAGYDQVPADEPTDPEDDGDEAVAPIWYAMIVPRPVDPRTLWQRLCGVPAPPVPAIATQAEALLRAAVDTIIDVDDIEWHDDGPRRPTTF